MTSVLVVCTGNVCRSPSAEGLLRRAFDDRLGAGGVAVTSAGTAGWEGSPPTEGSSDATAERGVDITSHRARVLTADQIDAADVVLAMAREHGEAVLDLVPDAGPRTFTMGAFATYVDGAAAPDLPSLVATAARARDAAPRDPWIDDVADPLGMPLETYRAMAAELDGLAGRIAGALATAGAGVTP
ncbi:MAG TPA: hypothetical protein VE032_01900 [Actinomycetota bacterium]|nr:hypothetical protein [Actinomycetota bacterium]